MLPDRVPIALRGPADAEQKSPCRQSGSRENHPYYKFYHYLKRCHFLYNSTFLYLYLLLSVKSDNGVL